jgi:hypothetical protein
MVERVILHSRTNISLSDRFQRLDEERKNSPIFNRRGGRRGGSGGMLPRLNVDSLSGPSTGRVDKRIRGGSGVLSNAVIREPIDRESNIRTVSMGNSGFDGPSLGRGRGRGRSFGLPLRGGLVFSPQSRARGTSRFADTRQLLKRLESIEREVMAEGSVTRLLDTDELNQAGFFRGRGRPQWRGRGSYRGSPRRGRGRGRIRNF